MAKKIIKAQMKQRLDTKANWAAQNPVLLAGELGIVSDAPNLYKVGDGVTAWNALPFRGFDGNIAQTTGNSETSVMSQKTVTEKLTELSEAISKAATPSGDPMHYNYIVVGALYNDTNAPITRTDYFGNSVTHLPGRWYLEGLGDLTNAEMREIYEGGKWWWSVDGIGFASASSARAILPSLAFQQVAYKAGFTFLQAFNQCPALEVIDLRTQPTAETRPELNRTKVIRMDFACQGSRNVKYIYGIIDASQQTSPDSFWIHTAGLLEVRLHNIKQSVKLPISNNISKASILYMIENEAVTNSAVITLHADAYARLSADADIVAALAAHPKVSLAKA